MQATEKLWEDEHEPLATTLARVKIRRLTTKLSDGAPASQHAGAPALVCSRRPAARGRALYAERRSLQRRVRRRTQIQASWRFKHVPSPCTLLFFATPDQRVALNEARTIMPPLF